MRKGLFIFAGILFLFFACEKKQTAPEEPVVDPPVENVDDDITFPLGYDVRLGDSVYRPPVGLVTDSVGTLIGDSIYTKVAGLRLKSVSVDLDTVCRYANLTLWFNDKIVDTFKLEARGLVTFQNVNLECKKGPNRLHIKAQTRGRSGQWFYVTMPENSIVITGPNDETKKVYGLPIQNHLKIR